MVWVFIVASGIFGTIIGSFLGVVVWRIGTGRGWGGRSMCLSCNRILAWYELIPIVSFLLQRGKCRTCKSIIPASDFWIEIASGIAFAGFGAAAHADLFGLSINDLHGIWILAGIVFIASGIVIAAYDIRHKIIYLPALIVFLVAGVVMGVAQQLIGGQVLSFIHAFGALRDAILVAVPFFILWAVSRGAWIGFGDIEIMAVAGFLLGISGGYSAVVLGFWTACAVILPAFAVMRMRRRHMDRQIPLGPFLLIGIYLVGILHIDIFTLLTRVIH